MNIEINLRLNSLEAQVLHEVVWNYVDMLEKSKSMADCDKDIVYNVCRQVLYSLPFVTDNFMNDGNTNL